MLIILDETQIVVDEFTPEQHAALVDRGHMYTIECVSGMKALTINGLGPIYEAVRVAALNMKIFFEDCTNIVVEFTDLVMEKQAKG